MYLQILQYEFSTYKSKGSTQPLFTYLKRYILHALLGYLSWGVIGILGNLTFFMQAGIIENGAENRFKHWIPSAINAYVNVVCVFRRSLQHHFPLLAKKRFEIYSNYIFYNILFSLVFSGQSTATRLLS